MKVMERDELLKHKQQRWEACAKQQTLSAIVPPRYQDWVLENYKGNLLNPLAIPLREGYPHCGYYGYADAIKGIYYGYAIMMNLAEYLYTQNAGSCVPDMFGSICFSSWVNQLKSATNAEAMRQKARNQFILLVYGLPTVKGTTWEHREMMDLFHSRFEYKCNTIWIAPLTLASWARAMEEPSIQSYIAMDCKVILHDVGHFREI